MDASDILTCQIYDPHSDMWIIGGCGVVEADTEIELTKKKQEEKHHTHAPDDDRAPIDWTLTLRFNCAQNKVIY